MYRDTALPSSPGASMPEQQQATTNELVVNAKATRRETNRLKQDQENDGVQNSAELKTCCGIMQPFAHSLPSIVSEND